MRIVSDTDSQLPVGPHRRIEACEKTTEKTLLSLPLATQLQACNSPSGILAVLQERKRRGARSF